MQHADSALRATNSRASETSASPGMSNKQGAGTLGRESMGSPQYSQGPENILNTYAGLKLFCQKRIWQRIRARLQQLKKQKQMSLNSYKPRDSEQVWLNLATHIFNFCELCAESTSCRAKFDCSRTGCTAAWVFSRSLAGSREGIEINQSTERSSFPAKTSILLASLFIQSFLFIPKDFSPKSWPPMLATCTTTHTQDNCHQRAGPAARSQPFISSQAFDWKGE